MTEAALGVSLQNAQMDKATVAVDELYPWDSWWLVQFSMWEEIHKKGINIGRDSVLAALYEEAPDEPG